MSDDYDGTEDERNRAAARPWEYETGEEAGRRLLDDLLTSIQGTPDWRPRGNGGRQGRPANAWLLETDR